MRVFGVGARDFRKTRGLSTEYAGKLHGGRPIEWATMLEPLETQPIPVDTATRRLIRAVLLQAISDLTSRSITHGDPRWRQTENVDAATQAARWFTANQPDVPFSFTWCCDALGLAPSCVRRACLRSHRPEIGPTTGHILVGPFTNGRSPKRPKTPRRSSTRVKVNAPPVDNAFETPLKNPLVGHDGASSECL